ncbi:MAG: peptidoglycan-associated lipoprotein Pal [Acidobacteria bacterium]|nr:peptidoglycan-associated lipoprotein Pal [Acidobacteriota bacterium]
MSLPWRGSNAPYSGGEKLKPATLRSLTLVFALSGIVFLGACHKKQAPPPPPPPPPPAAPTASLTASPDTVDKGQATTLTWQTANATDVTIDNGVGTVQQNGSQKVTPGDSTTYTLTAKGEGGTQTATTRVTVNAPPPPPPPTTSSLSDEDLFAQNAKDVFFDYDKSEIRPDQETAIQSNVSFLQQHPNIAFTLEGHCDERGSTEYNLALGDNRASAVKNALISGGVSADRIKTISYGKEKPFCSEHGEQCWQQNRRGHFVYSK